MDRQAVKAFAERFMTIVTDAALLGVIAIADRLGLFARLAESGAVAPSELSDTTGLQRRYLEELLAALAAGGILEYEDGKFRLPPEAAVALADPTSPYYVAGWAEATPAMISLAPRVAEAFRHGGGIPYLDYGESLIAGIDRMNSPAINVLLVRKWLPAMPDIVERLEGGARVADVGCGSGTASLAIAAAFAQSTVFGFDVDSHSLRRAERAAADRGLGNVSFHLVGAADLPPAPPFDLIMSFDVIHDMADPLAGLQGIHRALAPDGVYLMVEPNAGPELEDNLDELGALFYSISTLHCLPVALAGGEVGLGTAWGPRRAEELARQAGFSSFERLPIDNPTNAFYRLGVT